MQQLLKKAVILMGVISFFGGCASIVSGSKQSITIDSYPQGAEVIINGFSKGLTPLTLPVERDPKEIHEIIVKKDGFQPQPISLSSKMNPWFWGNIIIGGVLGSSTDSSTGAKSTYEPGQYMVNLVANAPSAPAPQAQPAQSETKTQ